MTYPPTWPGLSRPSTPLLHRKIKTWMPATSAGMTNHALRPLPSEIAARRKRTDIEGWRCVADHGGNRGPRRRTGREADMLVAERAPQTGMPWRRPDHG